MEMASSSLIRNFSCKEEHFVVSLTTLTVICSKPETLDRKPWKMFEIFFLSYRKIEFS